MPTAPNRAGARRRGLGGRSDQLRHAASGLSWQATRHRTSTARPAAGVGTQVGTSSPPRRRTPPTQTAGSGMLTYTNMPGQPSTHLADPGVSELLTAGQGLTWDGPPLPPPEVDVKPGHAGLFTDCLGDLDHYESTSSSGSVGSASSATPTMGGPCSTAPRGGGSGTSHTPPGAPGARQAVRGPARPGFEALPGQLAAHHHARLGRARPAPRSKARRGLSRRRTPCCPRVARRLERLGLTPRINLAEGRARLTVRLTRSTSLDRINRP